MADRAGADASTRRLWAACSGPYRRVMGMSAAHRAQFDDVIEALEAQPGDEILDAGCGTGDFELRLAQRVKGVRVCAVDFSEQMLRHARERCVGCEGVEFRQADLSEPLELASRRFDAAVCINVLFAVSDPERLLRELARIVKPGGRLVVVDPRPRANMGHTLLAQWRHVRAAPSRQQGACRLARCCIALPFAACVLSLNLVMGWWARSGRYRFWTADVLGSALHDAGFAVSTAAKTLAGQDWLFVAERREPLESAASPRERERVAPPGR